MCIQGVSQQTCLRAVWLWPQSHMLLLEAARIVERQATSISLVKTNLAPSLSSSWCWWSMWRPQRDFTSVLFQSPFERLHLPKKENLRLWPLQGVAHAAGAGTTGADDLRLPKARGTEKRDHSWLGRMSENRSRLPCFALFLDHCGDTWVLRIFVFRVLAARPQISHVLKQANRQWNFWTSWKELVPGSSARPWKALQGPTLQSSLRWQWVRYIFFILWGVEAVRSMSKTDEALQVHGGVAQRHGARDFECHRKCGTAAVDAVTAEPPNERWKWGEVADDQRREGCLFVLFRETNVGQWFLSVLPHLLSHTVPARYTVQTYILPVAIHMKRSAGAGSCGSARF